MKDVFDVNQTLEWLGEDLVVLQDKTGYCFTSDAILLADFVPVKKVNVLVDLCSGSGVIGFILHKKLFAKQTYLVEVQQRLAEMSQKSVHLNNLENQVTVLNRPLQNVAKDIGYGVCDVVVCNPPYKRKNASLTNKSDEIAIAKHEILVTLEEIIAESAKLLKFGGSLYIMNKEERLAEIVHLMVCHNIQPKVLKINKSGGQNIIIVKGVRGGGVGMKILVE